MKTVHFTDRYLLNPQHEVTVALIRTGGTGSQVLTGLARTDTALKAPGHPGLHVTAYAPDTITAANMGRQLFTEADAGLNKAACLMTRINRFFGTGCESVSEAWSGQPANITVTCTDSIASRLFVHERFFGKPDRYVRPYECFIYRMDFGNTRTAGQVIPGSSEIVQPASEKFITARRLPAVTELFDFGERDERDSGPSCSLAEALQKQDLFINSVLAQLGCAMLWKLFRECMTEYHGVFLNMDTMKTNPVKITANETKEN